MSDEYQRRAAIIVCLRAGRSPADIAAFTKLPRATVYRIASQFRSTEENEESATPARKAHSRERTARSDEMILALHSMIEEDPSVPMRRLAISLQVDEATIRRAVHEDFRYKSYRLKIRQALNDDARAKRLARCELLVCSLKHAAGGRLRFFSDEKMFTVDAKSNRKNDRWLAEDPGEVPVIGKSKCPASVHILGVVSNEGDVMPPHFFDQGQRVTKEVYLSVLDRVVKPWMIQVANGRPYVFQQDGAPAHTSHLVQNWLDENVDMFWSKNFWPPNSPDLNPMDYYVWGALERVTNKTPHDGIESLRIAIGDAMANMERSHLQRACSRFRSRLEGVIDAEGGWIE